MYCIKNILAVGWEIYICSRINFPVLRDLSEIATKTLGKK